MTCSHCGSTDVKENHFIKFILIAAFLLIWIPVLGWFVGPMLLIIALAAWMVKKYKKIQTMKCKSCKKPFTVDNVVYKESIGK
jgi:uncharacterized membrane protein